MKHLLSVLVILIILIVLAGMPAAAQSVTDRLWYDPTPQTLLPEVPSRTYR